ncbi:MAG: MFS transporter [Deltaproteobacteria bacterium]|nr:MFS transporter [Nannocystaceae bacterium]
MQKVLEELLSITVLVAVIGLVVARLPKIDVGHTKRYRARRVRNWVPVGLMYALLYMGRYNLTVSKSVFEKTLDAAGHPLMTNADFGTIFGIGTAVYGCAFIINGPLTDRIGGKRALLLGAAGTIVANIAMGVVTALGMTGDLLLTFSLLYAVNMYFQSFGAVAIVKINAPWFHVRERGTFGAIFGILIALGIYLAFDVGKLIVTMITLQWVFLAPALLLSVVAVVVVLTVRDSPVQAGFDDFDTADASSGDDGAHVPVKQVFAKLLRNPIIVTIACIEFCSGFLRQAILQWYPSFASSTGLTDNFIAQHWGMTSCCAGILGGVFAGVLSDHLFGSRRGPVTLVLFGILLGGSLAMIVALPTSGLGPLLAIMSMAVIGVHGMLSGTASMDFGGRRNAGVAVGIIDGFVYAGTAVMSFTYGAILPDTKAVAVTRVEEWNAWPLAMVPVAVLGFGLASRLWNARPQGRAPH